MIIKWRSAAILAAFLTVSGGPAPLLTASGAALGELNAAAGSTAQAASAYGEGVSDAFAYISRLGGIDGKPIALNGIRSDDLMRDAMLGADRAGSITKHQEDPGGMRDHAPAELEGVCLPATFLGSYRRATTVILSRNAFNVASPHAQRVYTTTALVRPDRLG